MEAARAASRGVSNSGGEDGEPVGGRAGQYARCSCADNKCSDAVLTFFFLSLIHIFLRDLSFSSGIYRRWRCMDYLAMRAGCLSRSLARSRCVRKK